jgi:hypothetical protein
MPTLIGICKDYCGTCPTFKENELRKTPPHALFCARGKSEIPSEDLADKGCNCLECPIYKNNALDGKGYYCFYGMKGKE